MTATSYTHTSPDPDANYYWVVACNSSGCSPVDSANPATTTGTAPPTPTASYEWDGSSIVVSWNALADADYYNIYHDDFFDAGCTVRRGSPSFCDELATSVTSYTHTTANYWVVACNNSGCSPVDSTNPVTVTDSPSVTVSACMNESGPPPLHQSVTDGDTELATTLAELCKEHLNTEYSYGFRLYETPLSLAVKAQATEIVQVLVNAGADVNTVTRNDFRLYETPLSLAVKAQATEIVRILVDAGADLNKETQNDFRLDETPLSLAVKAQATEIVRILVDAGADLNKETQNGFRLDETPLSLAVKAQATEIVRILVDAGADPNKETQNGFRLYLSPLEIANERGYTEIINILTATR